MNKVPLKSGKLPVAQPTSLQHFLQILVLHACRKILLLDPKFRVGLYMCGVTIFSLITDLVPMPRSYFSSKHNFFNVWFVKIGWGWTLLLLGYFVYLTSNTYCAGRIELVQKHLSRLGIATLWWYTWTSVFNYIEHTTGFCSTSGYDTKSDCRDAGGQWHGFDCSGHAFLLIHCALTISEEVRCVKDWSKIPEVIQKEEERPRQHVSSDDMSRLKQSYEESMPRVRIMIIVLTFFMMVWDIMLFATILYFHNMPQKLTGGSLAILGWFITYQLWYQYNEVWSPGLPGQGLLKIIKEQ